MDITNSTSGSKTTTNESNLAGTINQVNNITVVASNLTSLCPLTGPSGSEAICMRVNTDSADRLALTYDGQAQFGDGTNANDSFIYRQAANQIAIGSTNTSKDGSLFLGTINSTSNASIYDPWVKVSLSGDADPRFVAQADGGMYWGSGAATADTTLYRSGTNQLTIGSTISNAYADLNLRNLYFNGVLYGKLLDARNQAAGTAFMCSETGDAYWRVLVNNNGCIRLGNGTTSAGGQFAGLVCIDTTGDLYLSKDDTLTPDARGLLRVQTIGTKPTSGDNLILNPDGPSIDISTKSIINGTIDYATASASNTFINSRLSTDATDRFVLTNDGIMSFGGGAASFPPDVFLYRSASNTLAVGTTSTNVAGVLTANTLSGLSTYCQNLHGGYLSGSTYVNQGLAICAGTQPAGVNNVAIASSGSINTTSSNNIVAATSVSTIDTGAGSYNVILGAGSSSTITAGNNNMILNSSNATISATSSNNTIMNSNGGTISASSGSNLICCAGNGNVSIQGTSGGNFVFGSYVSPNTNISNSFIVSDSSNTLVGVGASGVMQCRMSAGYWLASNSANSTGLNMAPGSSSWVAISDAKAKIIRDTLSYDGALEALDKMDLYEYTYKDADVPKPIHGPTAQGFYDNFGPLLNNKSAPMWQHHGAYLPDGSEASKCVKKGEYLLGLDQRDEATIQWLVIKALRAEVKQLQEDKLKINNIVIDLVSRIEKLENAAAKPTRRTKPATNPATGSTNPSS